MLNVAREALIVGIAGGTEPQRALVRASLGEIAEVRLAVVDLPPQGPAAGKSSFPDVAIVILGEDRTAWRGELRPWNECRPRPCVVGLIADPGVEALRSALQSGAEEVLVMPPDRNDLARVLVKVGETRTVARSGVTCSLVSISGGVGVSYLTVNLARTLLQITGKRVALIDLDLQSSALATVLDVEPERTIADLVDPTSVIDSIRLESVLSRHESGLYLLAAPKRIEEGEMVSTMTVNSLLTVMRELFDFVVVDCGHHLSESLVAAWECSDELIYVIDQSVTAVRTARRFLELFGRFDLKHLQLALLLNRFSADNPISVHDIETALARTIDTTIPSDANGLAEASFRGKDMWAMGAKSATRLSVERLARELSGMPEPARKKGGLSMFFSNVGFSGWAKNGTP